jgi:hypothetical protein
VIITTACTFLVVIVLLAWWFMTASPHPDTAPNEINFEGISGDWTVQPPLSIEQISMYRAGRFGTSLIVVGVFTIHLFSQLLVPEHTIEALAKDDNDMLGVGREDEDENGEMSEEDAAELANAMAAGSTKVKLGPGGTLGLQGKGVAGAEGEARKPGFTDDGVWTPLRWKRAGLMIVSHIQTLITAAVIYFSFSPYFSINVYVVLPLFKCAIKLYEGTVRSTVREVLLGAPLLVAMQAAMLLTAQGAPDLTTYLISYIILLLTTTVLRLYLLPFMVRLSAYKDYYWKRFEVWAKGGEFQATPQQRLADAQLSRKLLEEAQIETEGMEPVLEAFFLFSTETTALIMTPFFQLLLLLLDAGGAFVIPPPNLAVQITGIPSGYGISSVDLQYYTIFSIVVLFAQFTLDIFILNAMELVHGWNLYDYVSYQRYRYTLRPSRWHMASRVVDASVSSFLQSTDMLCFSSQYYFMISGHAWGIIVMTLGIIVCLNNNYNMFSDWVFAVVVVPVVWTLMVR